jgi:hypothetical protein
LDEAIASVDPKYTISQVKTKFGELRFYYRMSENSTPEDFEYVRSLVRYAEEKAARTCMDCGEPGTHSKYDNVLCDTHKE